MCSFLNASWRFFFFFFNDTATTEIYTLSLHDALPSRPAQYAVGQGQLRNDPPQAPQDRRAGPHQRPPYQDRHGVELPRSPGLGASCRRPQRRGKRARLSRLTRGAAPRNNGIIPRPTGDLSAQLARSDRLTRLVAPRGCASPKIEQAPSQKPLGVQRWCEISGLAPFFCGLVGGTKRRSGV